MLPGERGSTHRGVIPECNRSNPLHGGVAVVAWAVIGHAKVPPTLRQWSEPLAAGRGTTTTRWAYHRTSLSKGRSAVKPLSPSADFSRIDGLSGRPPASLAMPPGRPPTRRTNCTETYDYKVVDGCRIARRPMRGPGRGRDRWSLDPRRAFIMGHRGASIAPCLRPHQGRLRGRVHRLPPALRRSCRPSWRTCSDACRWVRERGRSCSASRRSGSP